MHTYRIPIGPICLFLSALCLASCVETTSTQRDYAEARDTCRLMAEQRVGSAQNVAAPSENYKKSLLLAFKDCMSSQGWSVTGPEHGGGSPTSDAGVGIPPVIAATVAPIGPSPQEMYEKRQKECAYARQAMHHSSNARALARACDIECENKKQLAPDMPKPAACP